VSKTITKILVNSAGEGDNEEKIRKLATRQTSDKHNLELRALCKDHIRQTRQPVQ
jgi:hypothetical protein